MLVAPFSFPSAVMTFNQGQARSPTVGFLEEDVLLTVLRSQQCSAQQIGCEMHG